MTDPKSRKLIVLENPLLPTRIKEMIARCLFEDLQVGIWLALGRVTDKRLMVWSLFLKVPSISFIPPQVLSLLAIGRTSGLVVDIGFLETVVLPVSHHSSVWALSQEPTDTYPSPPDQPLSPPLLPPRFDSSRRPLPSPISPPPPPPLRDLHPAHRKPQCRCIGCLRPARARRATDGGDSCKKRGSREGLDKRLLCWVNNGHLRAHSRRPR